MTKRDTKRYLAVVKPRQDFQIFDVLIAGYMAEGKVLERGKAVGFVVDYYPDEKRDTLKSYGRYMIEDCATFDDASRAIEQALG